MPPFGSSNRNEKHCLLRFSGVKLKFHTISPYQIIVQIYALA